MDAFVALLRGINVGRGNRLPMAELRLLLETLGFAHVATLLNSGNAVFCAPAQSAEAAASRIGGALKDRVGLSIHVVVKSRLDFAAAVAGNPSAQVPDPSRLLVAFAQAPGELDPLRSLAPQLTAGESLHVSLQAAYLHCPAGISESRAAGALLGRPGRGVTTRNWATTLKLAALLSTLPPHHSPAACAVPPGPGSV